MMEWCHSVDCCGGICSISSTTSIERVSIREECDLVVVGGGGEHWRRRVFVDVNVGLTYKLSSFTRESIDDGMVPLS